MVILSTLVGCRIEVLYPHIVLENDHRCDRNTVMPCDLCAIYQYLMSLVKSLTIVYHASSCDRIEWDFVFAQSHICSPRTFPDRLVRMNGDLIDTSF